MVAQRPPFPPILLFFFNDTATPEIYTLSLHDALPIFVRECDDLRLRRHHPVGHRAAGRMRSEEHTSELQSRQYLVCRLLLGKNSNTFKPKAVRWSFPGGQRSSRVGAAT